MIQDEFNLFRDEPNKENATTNADVDGLSVKDTKPFIMVVDDDQNVRESILIAFRRNYNMLICRSGEECIEAINPGVFAVVLDIKMKGKDGFETFIELRKKFPFLPVIFHSAYQDLKDPYEIMNDYRPFGYVVKGGNSKELIHTLENAVDYYAQINKNAELVKQLQRKNLKLQELQENLERMVELRTKELKEALNKLSSINTTLHKLAITDGLTGLVNRRHFDMLFDQECKQADSNQSPLSLIMIDIDFFKTYNDSYGHLAGDSLLKAVALKLQDNLNSPFYTIARYGGEEFVAILPNTEETVTAEIAENMRATIESLSDTIGLPEKVTISLGGMTWKPSFSFHPEKILLYADNALLEAKRKGRNQVVMALAPGIGSICGL
jgi:diguanylate cyclase (GGDEF)-like protein